MTLIEMAVAIAMVAIFSTVLLGFAFQAQSAGNSAKLKNQSTKLGDQLIEKVIGFKKKNSGNCTWSYMNTNYKDKSYADADSLTCSFPSGSPGVTPGSPCSVTNKWSIPGTVFSQCVHLSAPPSTTGLLQIDVFVYYKDRGKDVTTKVSTYLSNI